MLLDIIKKIISPPFCEYCYDFTKTRSVLCFNCESKIKHVANIDLKITDKYNMPVYAIADYSGPLRKLILSKNNHNYLAGEQLAELIWKKSSFKDLEFDYLIPVPLHWTRRVRRGFNQAEVIAGSLNKYKKNKNKILNDLLIRSKQTKFQAELNTKSRWENVKTVFEFSNFDLAKEKYFNKDIVLVDDLMTTGATLVTIAKKLIKLKPKSISAVVAARVI